MGGKLKIIINKWQIIKYMELSWKLYIVYIFLDLYFREKYNATIAGWYLNSFQKIAISINFCLIY